LIEAKPEGEIYWASLWAVAHASKLASESVLKQLMRDKWQRFKVSLGRALNWLCNM